VIFRVLSLSKALSLSKGPELVEEGNCMLDLIRSRIRDVPDFPKPGIVFKDITPVLSDPASFRACIDALVARWKGERIDKVVGIESRGFIFAAPLAYALGAGFTVVRKPGKLPWETIREIYSLEYGENVLELHVDAIGPGERVLVVDDVLATGGTADATGRLVARQGADLVGYSFVVELSFLHGARKLGDGKVHALVSY
jgi:adenine phosphoribosyltransferase